MKPQLQNTMNNCLQAVVSIATARKRSLNGENSAGKRNQTTTAERPETPSPPKSFESYIIQTISAEEQEAADAIRFEEAQHQEFLDGLRASLQTALAADDKKTAIRIAHQLLEDNDEDENIHKLYNFLLSRVGVERREPYFAFSMQPIVRTLSAFGVLVPMIILTAHVLAPGAEHSTRQTDAITCVFAALFFGIPLIDAVFATAFNYLNRYRLRG